ncbi:MAG: heavy metal translocating P-type ATPase [Clostridia bacterium]|nr:heavy metal translocating P-type ATPase [Clostridia bacterium]
MQRLHYEIKGMSCAACVGHVERAVKGVLKENDTFTVSLLTNSVSILPAREIGAAELEAFEKRLAAAVKAAGYTLLLEVTEVGKKDGAFRKSLIVLIVSVCFTLAVMYLSMGGMIGLPIPSIFLGTENAIYMALAQLVLTLPVLILNFKFFRNGFSALFHRAPNMDSLIAVGAGASVIYGLVAVFMIATATDAAQIHSWIHDLYFESAATILTLVSFGKMLEARAKDKASDAVRSLADLSPKFAAVLRDGVEISVPVEELCVGDLILIRAGELIPVDGEVVFGEGSADESALTGESMPVEKEIGSSVRAACVLTSGALTVRATEVGENTSLSRIIRLLEDAAASKAPIARIADKVSAVFVPFVMGISMLTLILWLLITHHGEQAFRSAIAVLVISCPCALGLATPTAITVGIGRGARRGILFRNAEALEKLCSVKTVVFDKTGTVTEGKPSVTDIYAYGVEAKEMLTVAAAVERLSSHPLALAVQNTAQQTGLTLPEVTEFQSLTGVGAEGKIGEIVCRVGKPDNAFRTAADNIDASLSSKNEACRSEMGEASVFTYSDTSSLYRDFAALEASGKTAVVVSFDGTPVGVLGISDRIRSDSVIAVNALKNAGVACLMLTGDNEKTAAFVAQKTNLDGFRASLMPEDKERIVGELAKDGFCAMVGDGINDAPALVRADVGIAIGAGTDVAIDCADVVLSGSSLTGVSEAFCLSRASIRIIKQNLFWALFYNAVCIPVAAGVFYPLFGWQLSPMLASAAMSFSSVCVVLNALRLRKVSLAPKNQNVTQDFKENKKQEGDKDMLFSKSKTYIIPVEGMMCQHCVSHVKNALEAVKGVQSVNVSLDEKSATVTGSAAPKALITAINAAGYSAGNVKEI